jgi:hypothetical protein
MIKWIYVMKTNFMYYLSLTLSLLMLHICGVFKTFGEWYQKTNKTEDTNKLKRSVNGTRKQTKQKIQIN